MKKTFFLIILLILPSLTHSKISTSASQAIVIDVNSEKILYEKNSDQKISPASMTKIMTSIVAFDLIKKRIILILFHYFFVGKYDMHKQLKLL